MTLYSGNVRLVESIDLFVGDLARRGRSQSTLASYFRLLVDFADGAGRHRETETLELVDYERFLGRWVGKSPSTLASGVSLVKGFSRFLYDRGLAQTDVACKLQRPRRLPAEELDVVTVTPEDIGRMFDAVETTQELLCLSTALYLGARRKALAQVRRRDVDLVRGTIRFREKGGKVITKPLPAEYQDLLLAVEREGLWQSPSDYLIPNRRPNAVRRVERSDKVIWQTVKAIAARAGVDCHVHALRAAFACQFDDQHPGRVRALQALMGHRRLDTTMLYLRRKHIQTEMEANRDLTFAPFVFSSNAVKAHTGFEPVFEENTQPIALRRRHEELRTRADRRVRDRN
jgi:integrase